MGAPTLSRASSGGAGTRRWTDWLRGPGGRLDPVVALAAAAALGIVALYLPGVLARTGRALAADYFIELALLVIVLVALRHGLSRVTSRPQRRFWHRLTAAFGCWLAADAAYALQPGEPLTPLVSVMADACYLCFYLLILLALERRVHLGARASQRFRLRRLRMAGLTVLLTALLCYFVLIPAWLSRSEYESKVPSFLLIVALDGLVVLRFLMMWRESGGSSWRRIYALLALAMVLWTLVDAMDGLYYAGLLPVESGTALDLLDFLPFALVVAATRVRNREAAGLVNASWPIEPEPRPSAVPGFLILCLFALPLVHFGVSALGWGQPESRLARDLVVVSGLLTLAGLALSHELVMRRRNRDLRRRLDDLLADEKLESVQRLESLGVLAGGIAHDFNNLLVAILGNADLVLLDDGLDAANRKRVVQLRQAALQAADLAGQMLTYAGRSEFLLEPRDLNEVVGETLQILESVISKKAELCCDWGDDLPPVALDVVQIRQLIMNLITNASEALDGGSGRISLTTRAVELRRAALDRLKLGSDLDEGRYVALTVADTGYGMTERTLRRMFDPFFSTKFAGRGLGLAATLGIVRSHGGALDVVSELGVGTTATVLLPAADGRSVDASEATAEEWPVGESGLALVVEDADEVRTVLGSMLDLLGFEVIAARNGREGVEALQANRRRVRVVLLDLTMPVMDGAEALGEMQRLAPEIPVLIMSGYDDDSARRRCAGLKPQAFLRKPFRYDQLRDSLLAMLGAG